MNSRQLTPAPVLVVEDHSILRLIAVDFVEEAGFEAIEAGGADEAIAILEARPDIRVVFTDIQMPGSMDGIKLAAYIRRRWPPIELILTSAHHHCLKSDLPERGVFFSKPYNCYDIVAELRRFTA